MKKAKEVKKEIGRGWESTRNLNEDRDVIGMIGQYAVVQQATEWGEVDAPEYYDSNLEGDEYDFKFKGKTWDVKSFTGDYERLLIKNDSKGKKVDRYVFAKVDLTGKTVHILGWMSFDQFWEQARPFKSKNVKYPCHYIFSQELESFNAQKS